MNAKPLAFALIIGFTALARGATYFPVPLTPASFTYDIVVEANSAPPAPASINCTVDNSYAGSWGVNGSGAFTNAPGLNPTATTLYEIGVDLAALTTGMPLHNSIVTSATQPSHKFQMPPTYATNCAIMIAPGLQTNAVTGQGTNWVNASYLTGSFTLPSATPLVAISVVGLGGNSGLGTTMVISYNDGTTQTNSYVSQDWVNVNTASGGQSNVFTCLGRVFPVAALTNVNTTSIGRLWSADYTLSNSAATITNISFTFVPGTGVSSGRSSALIFGVSGSTDGVNFNPLTVTGYNADPVIEAAPLPYTATMDLGTNINNGNGGVNTWYEIGWNPYRPNTGFPLHGSTLTSTNTGRQYQMARDYTLPNATLIDTNHQLVNITPRAPAAFTAFSVLTAGASIGAGNTMSNILVLQHADGVNETNTFNGKDWFDNTVPAAYSCLERANFSGNARYFNNIGNAAGDPKIFESSFPMQDTTSPVTNIQVRYYNPTRLYTTNWTTYILAVSATVGGIPITLGTNTLAQNVYAGGTATFNVSLTFGTTPGFQWQYSPTEYGVYANLTDGGGISGSQAASLVISGVSGGNAGFYQCIVTNGLSTNTTFASPLTLLVSTAADVSQPGDTITPFPTSFASPAGQDVTKAIDGTLAKYLNNGSNGTVAPFKGPMGFVTTPNSGSSIVTAMRFFVAADVPQRDPADYMLEGSNDGGTTFATISSGALSLADVRNPNLTDPIDVTDQVMQEVDFANATAYYTYRVTFTNSKTNATATSIQVAEVQLLGVPAPLPPGIVKQPPASQRLFVGETFNVSIQANGPTPITYQWFDGVTPIPGKTNATLTLNNVQTTDSGNYTCVASNIYGGTASSADALTVLARPAGYAGTVLADNPIAYWRLDEGPDDGAGNNGTVAYDYAGGHNGAYTNASINVSPGYSASDADTSAGFGLLNTSPSYVGGISGINFYNPASSNNATFSVEAWVYAPQVQILNSAGIVTLGYGNGSEQFALDCGGAAPNNAFRFYFRDAATGAAHNAVSTNTTADAKWHHLVGVLDEVHSNATLYVDGQVAASLTLGTNLGVLNAQSPTNPFTIGSRTAALNGAFTNQFGGDVDEVAIYNFALSPSQVLNHYFAAGVIPVITLQPTNITASEGATATFHSTAYGSPTLSYQWWNSGGSTPTTPLSGQTSSTLTLANINVGQSGAFYQLVVSNTFGAVTSAPAQLTVISGPPQILPNGDLQTNYYFYAGSPMVLSVASAGSQPITYGWQYNGGGNLVNGSRITGANSNTLTIAPALLSDSGTYQLFMTNGQGTASSMLATVTVVPVLTFNGLGGGWSFNNNGVSAGIGYFIGTNAVRLTDSTATESSSTFFTTPVYVGGFRATWAYQDVTSGTADGVTFCIQNDPRGAAALGTAGGGLGYGASQNPGTVISPSFALEFNLYSGQTPAQPVGYAFNTNGQDGSYTSSSPVSLTSGHLINATLTYLNGTASLVLTDAVAATTFSASVNMNIPAVLGTNLAYVGFTGGDGGVVSTQIITNFTYVSLIPLNVSRTGQNVVLSWPIGTGGYQLQANTSINSAGTWTILTNVPTQVGANNQVVIPATPGADTFYRLVNP